MRIGNLSHLSLSGMVISITLSSLLCYQVNGGNMISRQADAVTGEMQEKILSNDFSIARRALDENIKQKRIIAIQMSLKSRFLDIRRGAADAIKEINNKASIPALIEALEGNYNARYTGGLEMHALKTELNRSLLSALQTLTGLTFPEGHELSPTQEALAPLIQIVNAPRPVEPPVGHEMSEAQIKDVIQECKRWWNENKDKFQ